MVWAGFGAKSPRTIQTKYPYATKFTKYLILQMFFSLNKNLYINLCDKKQIDDVKMKFMLIWCSNKLS